MRLYDDWMKMKRHWKKLLIILGLAVLVTLGAVGYFMYSEADKAIKAVTTSGSAVDLLTPAPLNGESTGVVNVLIAGNSVDDANHGGAALTDSIIVASYNLSAHQLTLVSVPRDLYVDVNGTYMKINAAYVNGGMDELATVVQQVTGLTINQRVLIDYTAFRDMIDAVGGIDITIDSPDPRGIYDPMIGFSISNGLHHLDGAQALLLARCRNDPTYDGRVAYGLPNGDFDRQANQRKIMEALLAKLTNGSVISNPAELKSVIDSLSGNVTTDMTAGQLRRLYDLSKQATSTQNATLRGTDTHILLANYRTVKDGDTLIPAAGIGNYAVIQQYVASLIATPASSTK